MFSPDLTLKDKIFLNNSNKTEVQNNDEEDSKEDITEQTEEFKIKISRIVQKILEKSSDEVLISFDALSFVLFVGVSECKDVIFKVLQDLNIEEDLKVTLDLPLITAGFDYLKISRISMDKQKALIGRSIDYSLQAMKPYCLKYIRDYLSTWRMIPSVKIDSIKLCLANFNNCKFDEVIQELLKIDCIITPLSNKTNDRSSSLNSLDYRLMQVSQEGLVKSILRDHRNFEDIIKRQNPIILDKTIESDHDPVIQHDYRNTIQNEYGSNQKWNTNSNKESKDNNSFPKGNLIEKEFCKDKFFDKTSCESSHKIAHPFKNKMLEVKDIIEIALFYNILKVDELLSLIKILYHEDNIIKDFATIYPVSLYKLLAQYECVHIFERLIELELRSARFNLEPVASIITNAFNYSIFSNKMLLSAYFVKRHIDLIYINKEECIVGLLHIFNEFSEFNGSSTYQKGILHFEEILYHIEKMINNFSYLLAEYFIESLENLVEVYNPNIYPVNYFPDKKQIISSHFLVWCKNPVKICVVIIYLLKKLQKMFPDLKIESISKKYTQLADTIIEDCENTKEVEALFTDYCMNGCEVIDLLCYENIEELLNNHYVGLIIADFWSGPFYRRAILTSSACYQIIASKIFKPNSFYDYLPNKVEEITKCIRGWHITKDLFIKSKQSDKDTHFFKLENWK